MSHSAANRVSKEQLALEEACIRAVTEYIGAPRLRVAYFPIDAMRFSERAEKAFSPHPQLIEELVQHLRLQGWPVPIMVDEDTRLISGRPLIAAAFRLNLTYAPLVWFLGMRKEFAQMARAEENRIIREVGGDVARYLERMRTALESWMRMGLLNLTEVGGSFPAPLRPTHDPLAAVPQQTANAAGFARTETASGAGAEPASQDLDHDPFTHSWASPGVLVKTGFTRVPIAELEEVLQGQDTATNFPDVAAEIRKGGLPPMTAIHLDENDTLVQGRTTLAAAKALGLTHVWVLRHRALDEEVRRNMFHYDSFLEMLGHAWARRQSEREK